MHALGPLTFVALEHLRHLPALQLPYIHIAVLRAAHYVLPTRQREGVGDGVLLVFVPPVYTPTPNPTSEGGLSKRRHGHRAPHLYVFRHLAGLVTLHSLMVPSSVLARRCRPFGVYLTCDLQGWRMCADVGNGGTGLIC
jgi:hypothetical protein